MCRGRWRGVAQTKLARYIEVAKAVMARPRYDVAGMVMIIPGIEVGMAVTMARPRYDMADMVMITLVSRWPSR